MDNLTTILGLLLTYAIHYRSNCANCERQLKCNSIHSTVRSSRKASIIAPSGQYLNQNKQPKHLTSFPKPYLAFRQRVIVAYK
eukprot:6186210-Pleurochrysis_carterae.AAC.1